MTLKNDWVQTRLGGRFTGFQGKGRGCERGRGQGGGDSAMQTAGFWVVLIILLEVSAHNSEWGVSIPGGRQVAWSADEEIQYLPIITFIF